MAIHDPLICSEFHRRIEAAVDRTEVVNRKHMEQHASQCAACRDVWQQFVLMETAIEHWRRRTAKVDLAERIIGAVRNEPGEPRRSVGRSATASDDSQTGLSTAPAGLSAASGSRPVAPSARNDADFRVPASRSRSIWPTVVTVAVVLVAGTLIMHERRDEETALNGDRDSNRPDAVVRVRPGDVQPMPDLPGTGILIEPADAQLPHLLADARSAWQGLAERAAEQTRGLGVFMPTSAADFGLEPAPGTSTGDEAVEPSTAPAGIERTLDLFYQATGFIESQAT